MFKDPWHFLLNRGRLSVDGLLSLLGLNKVLFDTISAKDSQSERR